MSYSRAHSPLKWYVLALLSTLFIASYHCILCVSALQYEMMATFSLSDGAFALYSTIVFGFAALIALFCPFIIGRIGLYNTMILASFSLCIGQCVFLCGLYYFSLYSLPRTASISIQYMGRVLIGLGYGIDCIAIYCTVNVWFKETPWMELALAVINVTFDVGMLSSRYALTPIYRASDNSLFAAFCLGFLLCLLRVIASFGMKQCEEKFVTDQREIEQTQSMFAMAHRLVQGHSDWYDAEAMDATHIALHDTLDSDISKMREFDANIWCLIVYFVIGTSVIETVLTQFTLPLMTVFAINEAYANLLLSTAAFFALTMGIFWGWCMSKTGHLSLFLISCMTLLFLCTFVMQIYDLVEWQQHDGTGCINYIVAWFCIVCFVTGLQHFFLAAISSLMQVSSLRLSAVSNSMAAVLSLTATMAMSYAFGVLVVTDGERRNYQYSLAMMSVSSLIGLIIAVVIHIMDVRDDGPLHKSAAQKYQTDNGETQALLQ